MKTSQPVVEEKMRPKIGEEVNLKGVFLLNEKVYRGDNLEVGTRVKVTDVRKKYEPVFGYVEKICIDFRVLSGKYAGRTFMSVNPTLFV